MAEPHEQASRRGRLRRTAWAALLLSLLAGLLLLWSQRRPVAIRLIDRHFAASGVSARYTLIDLGPRRAVLRDLRIGDPARPDLVAPEVVVRFGWGIAGPRLSALTVRGARLRARLAGGRLSLGAIDRLLPPPSGAPFALPGLQLSIADSSIALDSPAGPVGIAIAGEGYLPSGFTGRIAASAPQLRDRGCTAGARGTTDIQTRRRNIEFAGDLTASSLSCVGMAASGGSARFTLSLPERADRWRGNALVALADLDAIGVQAGRGVATFQFAGDAANTAGVAALRLAAPRYASVRARMARLDGSFTIGRDARFFDGRLGLTGASAPPIASPLPSGTPLSPLAARASGAVNRALRRFDASADLRIDHAANGRITARSASVAAASGASVRMAGPIAFSRAAVAGDGKIILGGGGLPELELSLRAARSRMSITAEGAAYSAPRAQLEPFELRYAEQNGRGELTGKVTVSGPLGDGRVDRLQLPLALRIDRRSGFAMLTDRCQPLHARGFALAGMTFGQTSLSLCPAPGGALLRSSATGLSGGLRWSMPSLRGRMNGNPLEVSAAGAALDWRGSSAAPRAILAIVRVAVRLGAGTSLKWDRLAGTADVAGGFRANGSVEGLGGQLANIPLLMDKGSGRWRFAGSVLTLDGATARITDAASPARFLPIRADGVTLRYADGRLAGEGGLASLAQRRPIGGFRLTHRFATASGEAHVTVPGLTFDENFQPEQLTPLTIGVIADVRGAISGEGAVRWTPAGITSDGRFGTGGTDLAAAFGPVRGLSGTVRFDDLLALATPPGQEVTVAEINPGISVTGGRISFQLLPQQRVAVEEGRWPFAGGTLILEPSLLDFGKVSARRFTLRMEGLDAAAFLQQLEFKNFSASGVFDGRLPLIFEGDSGRIEGGRLAARAPGGLIAYVGEVGGAQLGAAGQFAFDALKKLRYTQLAIALDGALAGEVVSRVDFNGVNEAPVSPAGSGMALRATGLPFRFNVTVRAPFQGLMNAATSFGDARSVVGQALSIQPPDSAPVPAR